MTDPELKELKRIGHDLLELYISIDYSKLTYKVKKNQAYTKIQSKLRKAKSSHFGMMTNTEEVLETNRIFREMIVRKEKDNKHRGLDKVQIAPNLQELQRSASLLNRELLV